MFWKGKGGDVLSRLLSRRDHRERVEGEWSVDRSIPEIDDPMVDIPGADDVDPVDAMTIVDEAGLEVALAAARATRGMDSASFRDGWSGSGLALAGTSSGSGGFTFDGEPAWVPQMPRQLIERMVVVMVIGLLGLLCWNLYSTNLAQMRLEVESQARAAAAAEQIVQLEAQLAAAQTALSVATEPKASRPKARTRTSSRSTKSTPPSRSPSSSAPAVSGTGRCHGFDINGQAQSGGGYCRYDRDGNPDPGGSYSYKGEKVLLSFAELGGGAARGRDQTQHSTGVRPVEGDRTSADPGWLRELEERYDLDSRSRPERRIERIEPIPPRRVTLDLGVTIAQPRPRRELPPLDTPEDETPEKE